MEGVRADVNSCDQGWLISLHYNAHLRDQQAPPAHCPVRVLKDPKTESSLSRQSAWLSRNVCSNLGPRPGEMYNPHLPSALVASALKARRQAGILAMSCSRIIEALTWDRQRLTLKE